MSDYRIYKIDDKSGKTVCAPCIVQCEDDAAALTLARQYSDDHTFELWDGGRRVARVTPHSA